MKKNRKAWGIELKSVAESLLGDNGVRYVPLNLTPQPGRILRDIIDKEGKVFMPNPYDIPRDPQRVLAFAAHLILGMMDCDRLKHGQGWHFITEAEWMQYRRLTYELLSGLNVVLMKNKESMIEYQVPGK